MHFQTVLTAVLGLASLGVTVRTWSAWEESERLDGSVMVTKLGSTRPSVVVGPKPAFQSMPASTTRNRTCTVKSHNDGKTDDSQHILDAIKSCNNGGHVVFTSGAKYIVGTALDLTFLQSIDLDIQGYVQFTNDTDYWQAHAFKQVFQNATTFFQLGGKDVNVYGGGFLDGNGQVWYDLYAKNNLILRPILFGTIGLNGGTISNLNLRYSPQWYNLVANSTDVVFDNITISGFSSSSNTAKNTDGWDTYRSNNLVIQNSVINNGDDCVSFKPNSTKIVVQNLYCNGSHGISVGSLGQYMGETDIVEDVTVYNISMSNASDMARIKVWPGNPSALSADLQGGGGTGQVRNVLYDTMTIANVDYAIEVTQCYGQSNLTLCNEYPSSVIIQNVTIQNLSGTTSKSHSPYSGYVVCSSPNVCKDIYTKNISVTSPAGVKNEFKCGNVDASQLTGITCKAAS